jgi:hypothetical protein
MPEGLSPGEVGKEISEHRAHAEKEEQEGPAAEARGRDRVITIIEAVPGRVQRLACDASVHDRCDPNRNHP